MACTEAARHEFIFQRVKAGFAPATGKIAYRVNGREVCRDVFLLAYPTSPATLTRIVQRVVSSKGAAISYAKHAEEGNALRTIRDEELECVADLLFWAEENGSELIGMDYLDGKIYVPKVDITDIAREVGLQHRL
jgi:hypothetical protein|tara:strand:+ start:858 stop:1262 length:405 start_codon:yes stop_codon:yes gene_type:complete